MYLERVRKRSSELSTEPKSLAPLYMGGSQYESMDTLSTNMSQIRTTRGGLTYVKITKSGSRLSDYQEQTRYILNHFGQRKHWFIMNYKNVRLDTDKEIRDYIVSRAYRDMTHAIAWLINDSLGKIMGNLITSFVKPHYPFQVFLNERDAVNWLASLRQSTNLLTSDRDLE